MTKRIKAWFAYKRYHTANPASSSNGLCSRCDEIMNNIDGSIPVRSWRTPQFYCGAVYLLNPLIRHFPPGWPERDIWDVSTRLSEDCPLCSFFSECASKMGLSPRALLSNELSLVARLAPYKFTFTTGLPTPPHPLPTSAGTAVPITRVLELIKVDGKSLPHRTGSWDDPKWLDTHLILPARTCSRNGQISDTVDYGIISNWLAYCQSRHQSCTTTPSVPLTTIIPGLHLIDCKRKKIIPAEEMSTSTYITLSYVWGSAPVDLETMQSSTVAPSLPNNSRLPKVIRDAMEVVRRLGYRYLWVDRYCIPQGNSEVKYLQIQRMGKIYSLSDVTIIAAAGEDAEYGLPGVNGPPRVPQLWTTITHGNSKLPIVYFNTPNWEIGNSVWASRGWTYQEAVLSRRRLVFTDRNVYFQCQKDGTVGQKGYSHFIYDSVFPTEILDAFGHVPSRGWQGAWRVISAFAKRTLSFEKDTLKAMQGIFEVWREEHSICVLYGLPIFESEASSEELGKIGFWTRQKLPPLIYEPRYNSLLRTLLWESRWPLPFPREIKSCNARSYPRRTSFPSWTWAGWRSLIYELDVNQGYTPEKSVFYTPNLGPVKVLFSFDDGSMDWITHKEEILRRSEVSCFPTYLTITGEVFDTTITCKGVRGNGSKSLIWSFSSPPFLADDNLRGLLITIPPDLFEEVEGNCHSLLALPLFSEGYREFEVYTLILRQVGEDDHGPIFERVTCFSLRRFFMANFLPGELEYRRMELRIR